jgi:tripartite-type tricarboxylate transporter receptor subunit TctC
MTALIIAAFVFSVAPPSAFPQEPFYKNKAIRIVVGYAAGGGFDTYSRTIARHLGKHIPGNPAVIVDNMTGAGGIIAANHVYKVAKPDGLTIVNWIGSLVIGQVMGRQGIEFEARRFQYIGSPVRNHDTCVLTKGSGITSVERWMAAKTPIKLGGVAPNATTDDVPKILKAALGLPIQLVSGYKGTSVIRLAAEAGEVAGVCGLSWASAKSTWGKSLQTGDAVVVLQNAPKAHPELPNVPLAISLAKTEEGRQFIEIGIHDASAITYLYSLAPGTPKDRIQNLRHAFLETMKDPEFLADAKKANMDLSPLSGEEVERTVERFFKLSPAMVAKLKEILE